MLSFTSNEHHKKIGPQTKLQIQQNVCDAAGEPSSCRIWRLEKSTLLPQDGRQETWISAAMFYEVCDKTSTVPKCVWCWHHPTASCRHPQTPVLTSPNPGVSTPKSRCQHPQVPVLTSPNPGVSTPKLLS